MMKRSLLLSLAALCLGGSPLIAQNLLSNGGFGMENSLDNIVIMKQYDLEGKGFELDFDANRWAAGWVINGAMAAAKISFIDQDDGTRALKIDSQKESHIYPEATLRAGEPYRGSFSARGDGNLNPPKVLVYAYYYSYEGWLENRLIETFDLTASWEQYQFEIPEEAPEGAVSLRIAFGFTGITEFKTVEATQPE